MRLRQIAMVAADLEAASEALCGTLGIEVACRDPSVGEFGLANIVAAVGGEFLEIVSPIQPGTAGGRYIERRGGDSGYMVILHGADALAARARTAEMGLRAVWTSDEPDYIATHLHPRDVGGILLSLDSVPSVADYNAPMCTWPPAGTDWRDHPGLGRATAITGVEMHVAEPAPLAALWGRILERPAIDLDNDRMAIDLDNARLLFAPIADSRGPGVHAVQLATADAQAILLEARARGLDHDQASVTICGTVFRLNGGPND